MNKLGKNSFDLGKQHMIGGQKLNQILGFQPTQIPEFLAEATLH